MICPSCGQEVPELRFCVSCGSPLADAAPQGAVPQPAHTANMPSASSPQPPTSSPQPPTPMSAPASGPASQMPQAAPANQAPNTAFVLVIVGLVLSCLFVTFVPGLVCSIVGLVLNAGYGKKGYGNPRKTATTVIGVIGIVVSALCLVVAIGLTAYTARVVDELDRQGVDITADDIELTADSDGRIGISVRGDESSGSPSGAAGSSGSTAPLATLKYDGEQYHDSEYNPTLYSVVELTGSEFQDLLDLYHFYWDDDILSWYASDGSLFGVESASDVLTKSQIGQLPVGAAGQPVVIILTVEGYGTPSAAFDALSKDVTVEGSFDGDGVRFAIVHGSPMVRYLVAVSETDDDEQTFLLFTDEAISSGLFEQLTGVNAGASIDAVWNAISGANAA